MTGRLLSASVLLMAANVFSLGYLSSNGASFDVLLTIPVGLSCLLSVAIAACLIVPVLSKKKDKEKKKTKEATEANIRQSVVIPIRCGQVCMVSAGDGKKWVFPKGRIEKSESAAETALREVWEEAGLLGSLQVLVGSYLYEKDKKKHFALVFKMSVAEEADGWPEVAKRERCWLNPSEAATRLHERDSFLRSVLCSFDSYGIALAVETTEHAGTVRPTGRDL